ncbi:DUF3043 domain-containing protein [Leifsonia sp. 1010]|uniref:DUF3043 domain-containing protein n=1 Tax=Leifsonia sp. 1010 TaxID=2817769 RepID=UPI0028676675|nr:DUF3043 domain-containing protein [Leifsonia sp. 1010]MDR6613643.1 hypothetical protein [Leifsonia sp. 1010]
MAKRQNAAGEAETPVAETPEETAARLKQGKGAPTPSRRQQEAARKRPLVPTDRKEAARVARQKQAEAREKARLGMAAGDDRYLTARDRGPQRRYVRDYVDARFSIGEFLIPVMLIVIILTFLPWPEMQVYGLFALWGFFLIAVIDCFVLGFLVRKRIAAKFGATKVERGLRWYAAMRALQLRVMRLPKPQVKRGQFPS